MNPEDRLRRASREIERVTASLTPPPITDVHRSARMQGIGVSLATAVAVFVLVGGAVLLLGGRGATTREPAGPGVTTTTTSETTAQQAPGEVDGVPVRVLAVDGEREWQPGDGAIEIPFTLPTQIEPDVHRAIGRATLFDGSVEDVVVLGESGGLRSYLLNGQFTNRYQADGTTDDGGVYTSCAVSLNEVTFHMGCFADGGIERIVDIDDSGDGATFGIVGTTDSAANVALLDIAGTRVWSRVREGTVNVVGHGSIDSQINFTIFDAAGGVLEQGNIWSADRAARWDDSETTTTAPAGSCSAGDLAPAALALSSIPQPVARTLGEIVNAARQCDFDRLAAIGGDNFTASYGDSDPAAFWAGMEESDKEPMYPLLKILDMPYGTIETEQGALYVWPSAYAHQGSWETTPEADVEALRSLYSDEDLQGFADFGGYFGYRLGIWENGDWSFFVAGD